MKLDVRVRPDFDEFEKVITGKKQPTRVHLVELGADEEVMRFVVENVLDRQWVPYSEQTRGQYIQQRVGFQAAMGYDFAGGIVGFEGLPQFKERRGADTAQLSRGQRHWVEEGGGIIKNWDDFERIDWDGIRADFRDLEEMRHLLPDGMRMVVGATIFEMILERFLGYEDLFILSVENPELVQAVFDRWGQKVLDFYEQAVQYPQVGAIFHADDLGFKLSLIHI